MAGFQFWADSFTTSFVPQVEAFAETLANRVLPGFDTVDAEGRRLERDIFRELSRGGDEYFDPADAADTARDQAITYWVTMYGIQQGMVNLFGVGLWHLFEQQLAYFIRHGLREPWDPAPAAQSPIDILQEQLHRMGVEIDVDAMASYSKMAELRLLANCAKHGDGAACEKLRARRPDLFTQTPPHVSWPTPTPVIAPLGGQDLYLSPEGFQEYVRAVIAFWNELARKILDAIAR